ncbi:hypothetical protein F5Y17DRAFT_39480 [Xylariaceae sp. FL0594]|nr:hypothetical protein F5Y17DRAFT_39480 [Xylariaceae sp. FL0594]
MPSELVCIWFTSISCGMQLAQGLRCIYLAMTIDHRLRPPFRHSFALQTETEFPGCPDRLASFMCVMRGHRGQKTASRLAMLSEQ